MNTIIVFICLIALATAEGYGNGNGGYWNHHDNACDFSDRDQYGVPRRLVPENRDIILIVKGFGWRAYTFDKSTHTWVLTGRQVQLFNPKTNDVVGSIGVDATTVPLDTPLVIQYSYFPDGSWATRKTAQVNITNDCDYSSAPNALYDIESSSDYEGLLTGALNVAVYDTYGGAAPRGNGYDNQVKIVNLKVVNKMDMVYIGLMEINMMEDGKMVKEMDMVVLHRLMGMDMKENGKTINKMDMV